MGRAGAVGVSAVRLPREAAFSSRLRSAAVAARVGLWLGICFGVCFLTGVLSHYAQLDRPPVPLPTRPVWGYRVTQGVHVATGTAAVPLLLVKLWAVYPKLFATVPRQLGGLVRHGLERASIGVLVAAAIFQLATGVANAAQWYPWDFSFRAAHYALAWIALGALVVHVAVKLPVLRDTLGADVDDTARDRPTAQVGGPVSRRGLLRVTWLATGTAVVASAAGTIPGLDRLAVLAPRSLARGEVPVNGTARGAGVTGTATAQAYRCVVAYGDRELALTREELLAFPQRTEQLPIACVEGWSANGSWTGVRLRDLLDAVGAPRGAEVGFVSLEEGFDSVLPADFADDDRTLLALGLDGEPLSLDHGYPARLIAPNRPGVLQTKWVTRIEVSG